MSKRSTIFWLIFVSALMVFMPSAYAHAYLDPGSGSLIIQLVIAGLLGLAVTAKLFWGSILVFLKIKKPVDLDANDSDDLE